MIEYISKAEIMDRIINMSRRWGEEYDALQILGDIEDMKAAFICEGPLTIPEVLEGKRGESVDKIGERIKDRLKELNMTRKELAWRAGITEAAVSRYIKGQRTPRAQILVNIAHVLDTTPNELCGFREIKFD